MPYTIHIATRSFGSLDVLGTLMHRKMRAYERPARPRFTEDFPHEDWNKTQQINK